MIGDEVWGCVDVAVCPQLDPPPDLEVVTFSCDIATQYLAEEGGEGEGNGRNPWDASEQTADHGP